jgi:hypothetical protein
VGVLDTGIPGFMGAALGKNLLGNDESEWELIPLAWKKRLNLGIIQFICWLA